MSTCRGCCRLGIVESFQPCKIPGNLTSIIIHSLLLKFAALYCFCSHQHPVFTVSVVFWQRGRERDHLIDEPESQVRADNRQGLSPITTLKLYGFRQSVKFKVKIIMKKNHDETNKEIWEAIS